MICLFYGIFTFRQELFHIFLLLLALLLSLLLLLELFPLHTVLCVRLHSNLSHLFILEPFIPTFYQHIPLFLLSLALSQFLTVFYTLAIFFTQENTLSLTMLFRYVSTWRDLIDNVHFTMIFSLNIMTLDMFVLVMISLLLM